MASVFGAGEAAPMLGGDGIAQDPTCLQDAGGNSAGVYATVPVRDVSGLGTAQPVIASFKAAFPRTRDYGTYTVIAYDAAAVLYEAIGRAIQLTGGELPARGNVISQLSATQTFLGATGVFGFDPNGDTTRRIVSVYEAPATPATQSWTTAGEIDYTAAPPY
jgi:ABC-type branched-subunit amino acid transport system substrate-binding protein